MLKIFSLNIAEFITLNESNFQHVYRVSGGFALDPIQGSERVWTLLGMDGTPFVPSETNSWLRPSRPCHLVENFGPDLPGYCLKCVKCGRLIIKKIIEIVATRGQILS